MCFISVTVLNSALWDRDWESVDTETQLLSDE